MGPRWTAPRRRVRGSGRAGGDPGNGGLRTWSGRERSSHKHRLHVRGRTSPAHPGPPPAPLGGGGPPPPRPPPPPPGGGAPRPHAPPPPPTPRGSVPRAPTPSDDTDVAPRQGRAVELPRRRPPLPPATLRGGRRPGPCRPVAPQCP